MNYNIEKLIADSVGIFKGRDKDFFVRFINERRDEIIDNTMSFTPYLHSITPKNFYKKITLQFEKCPVDSGDVFQLGVESFRFDEILFLRKSDGKLYYKNYNNEVFEVADSFVKFWEKIDHEYDIMETLELAQIDQISLDEEVCRVLKQCFSRECIQDIIKIYAIINSDGEGLEIPLSANSNDGITLSTFYDKANFSLLFPFIKISDPRLGLPAGSWWRIGEGNEDEDTGPDNGTLIVNSETGSVFWYSIFPDWINNELRMLSKKPQGFFSSIVSLFKALFTAELDVHANSRPYNKNIFKVADSFESFITNLVNVSASNCCSVNMSNDFSCVAQTPENQESVEGKTQKPEDKSCL